MTVVFLPGGIWKGIWYAFGILSGVSPLWTQLPHWPMLFFIHNIQYHFSSISIVSLNCIVGQGGNWTEVQGVRKKLTSVSPSMTIPPPRADALLNILQPRSLLAAILIPSKLYIFPREELERGLFFEKKLLGVTPLGTQLLPGMTLF